MSVFLLVLLSLESRAQSNITDGTTPPSVAPGAPAGSYPLSDLESLNLFNGNMNLRFPLLNVGGRGSAQYPLMLSVEQRWTVDHTEQMFGGVTIHSPQGTWWFNMGRYRPARLLARYSALGCESGTLTPTLTRVTFTAPDGTEYEMRDALTDGEKKNSPCDWYLPHFNRGKIFKTRDGSSATLVSDADVMDSSFNGFVMGMTGYVMLRDGTRYRFDNGEVSWVRDRNGNKITFAYTSSTMTITDSLNRQVLIEYGVTEAAPYGLCDRITFRGFGGATRILRVSLKSLSAALRTTQAGDSSTVKTYAQLFPELNGAYANDFNPSDKISNIWLPDGRHYDLYYNVYGEVARVVLPTGGAMEYDWSGGIEGGFSSGATSNAPGDYAEIFRKVLTRRVYTDSSSSTPVGKTTYSKIAYCPTCGYPTEVTIDQKTASDTVLARSKHYFYGVTIPGYNPDPFFYAAWKDGREYRTEALDTGTTVLRRQEQIWQQRAAVSWWTFSADAAPSNDPRITETISTLTETSQVSKQTFTYSSDEFNNQTDIYEYDYGSGVPGALIRRTHTDYLTLHPTNGANYATDNNIHIRSLPVQTQVFDAGGLLRAQTAFEYDNYSASGSNAPLTTRVHMSGHDSGTYSTAYFTRGNVTKTTRYLLDGNGSVTGSISSYAQYDIAGNVVRAIDGRGNATTIDFSDRFGSPDGDARANAGAVELAGQYTFAFPTLVTNPLGHTAYTQFDYYLSKPVDTEDPNGVKASLYYEDALDRPTRGISALGTTAATQTRIYYDDPGRTITSVRDKDFFGQSDNINGSGLKSASRYDGLGRTWRVGSWTGSAWNVTDTEFDALGRTRRVSSPYSATDLTGAVNPSGFWTTTTYDALSRALTVTTPDTATVTTAYSGNQVMVTDQTGKKRLSQTDALGRLTAVWEVTPADQWTTTVGFSGTNYTAYQTSYLYDALGNLRRVDQGAQTRWFGYDSLSRLIRVKNPETAVNYSLPAYTDPVTGGAGWSTAYTYDNNGNLLTKTDARGATGSYTYDALNRMTVQSNWEPSDGTTTINFYYDSATNGKGRLWYTYDANKEGTANWYYNQHVITAYDALGRPTNFRQDFFTPNGSGGNTQYSYSGARTYDLAGNLKTQTYPSNRTVSYSYNSAGQMSGFTGKLGGIANGANDLNYATGMLYNPRGQMIRETFGTTQPLYQRKHYNQRGQLFDIRLGTDSNPILDSTNPADWQYANGSWNRGAIRLYYSASLNDYSGANPQQADNNGNVYRMDHFVPTAVDASHNITNWVLGADTYEYDELNRITRVTEWYQNYTATSFKQSFRYDRYGNRTIDLANTDSIGGGVTRLDFKALTANNRLVAQSDTTGDDPGSDLMRYDKAGNLVYDNFSPSVSQRGSMTYDAENHMITAVNGTQRYRYDANGRRVKQRVGQAGTNGEVWQVYGPEGELLAEYPKQGAATVPTKEYGYRGGQLLVVFDSTETGDNQLRWLITDHLGSTRMLVNKSGSLAGLKRRDYLPFGEELASTIGHRAAGGSGYAVDDKPRVKFGAKERDTETGLDFFEARYYASVQGRFTSPDKPLVDQWQEEPQTWNLYTYVLNNPLKYDDPTGLWKRVKTEDDTIIYEAEKGDTIEGLAKILNVPVKSLIGSVGGDKVQIGQQFDVTNYRDYQQVAWVQVVYENEVPSEDNSDDTVGNLMQIAGIWTPTRRLSGVRNAWEHWLKHRKEFPNLRNAVEYVKEARKFLDKPPSTALVKRRPNGDKVIYDPVSDTFAVADKNGVPRTMYKPDPKLHGYPTNIDYFNAQ
ncbi:MAG TPA: RHS repeat-associated core domain-containing protein [Blastocatellia bacterium]|nr:RHS repeat-associated core domain-containing protein [Blastocatellia bacterium]